MGIFQQNNTSDPKEEKIGRYSRRSRGVLGGFEWVDNSRGGAKVMKEVSVGNWILKPNGTKVHISARKANEQAARQATRTQPVTSSSVTFSPISPEYRELYEDQKSIVTPSTTQQSDKTKRRISPRINRPNYAQNFANFKFSPEEIAFMEKAGVKMNDARSVQDFILKYNKNADLGSRKGIGTSDGFWGGKSEKAFEALRKQGIFTPKVDEQEKPIVEQPVVDAPDPFGYKTSNTYEDDDFANKLKRMGIRSNADLMHFMYESGKEGWKGDAWQTQFRSDVDRLLGGDYSDDNIRKVFKTKNGWGNGFMGRGDFGDFQNVLQTNAGVWNGIYDAKQNETRMNIARQQYANKLSQQFTVPQLSKPTQYPLNRFMIGNIGATTLGNPVGINETTSDLAIGYDGSV